MLSEGPSRTALIVPGVVCIAFAVALAVQLGPSSRDSYWTPEDQAPRLADVNERIEVLIDGESLPMQLAEGRIQRQDGSAPGADDVTVRFNGAGQIELRQAVLLTATLTAGIVLLVLAFLLPGRKRRDEGAVS
jgi:hypothetical protein